MVDILLKLLEKLIEFFKIRKDIEHKTFEMVLTPIFKEIEVVHKDYLSMFESCKCDITAGEDLTFIAKKLMAERLEQEALRNSIITMVESFTENPDLKQYADFFHAVAMYFYGMDYHRSVDSRSSHLLKQMEVWSCEGEKESLAAIMNKNSARQSLLKLITEILKDIRSGWKIVTHNYAELLSKHVVN